MKPVEWFSALLSLVTESYRNAAEKTLEEDSWPVTEWDRFFELFKVTMVWSAVTSAASIRQRAIGDRLDMNIGWLDKKPSLYRANAMYHEVVDRNPWLKKQQLIMTPIVEARTLAVLKAEREFYFKKTSADIRTAKTPAGTPMYRLEMGYRNTVSAISNTSQQLELADPEIGDAFPYSEYLTRDDRRVRPTHQAMYGFVAVKSWDGWMKILPPNGFNCRCYVIYRTIRESKDRGWLNDRGRPRFEYRFPNSASRLNFEKGTFPDKGWAGPKIVAAANAA